MGEAGDFYVNEHNTKMPHPAFGGQTPDEMFFGTGTKVSEELALAKTNARAARMAANRAMSCESCFGNESPNPRLRFRRDFNGGAIANMK